MGYSGVQVDEISAARRNRTRGNHVSRIGREPQALMKLHVKQKGVETIFSLGTLWHCDFTEIMTTCVTE